jgi:hypothetical protein
MTELKLYDNKAEPVHLYAWKHGVGTNWSRASVCSPIISGWRSVWACNWNPGNSVLLYAHAPFVLCVQYSPFLYFRIQSIQMIGIV